MTFMRWDGRTDEHKYVGMDNPKTRWLQPQLLLCRDIRRMDGSHSAGNPSAASSRTLPAHADEDTLEPADWISASEENDQHREESVSLPESQDQQSPAETHKSPAETNKSPAETHKSLEQTEQSQEETHQSSEETTQRSAKKHQSPHNPVDKHLSSPTKPDKPKPSLRPKKQQKLRDSPPTEKQKTNDSPSLKDQPEPEPDQPSTKQDPLKPSSVCTDQKKPGDLFCTKHEQKPEDAQKHQNQEDLCPKQQRPEEDPPPPLLNTQQAPPPPHLDTQQAPPPPHLNTQQAPPPPHLNTQQAPPPPHLNTQQAPPPPHLNTQQAPPPPLLDTQQAPPSPQVLTSMTHPNEDSTLAPPLTTEVLCEQGQPRPLVSFPGEPKLCGFLQKQGGPLRAWKQRWFTYEDKRNQLFYYRTPQDVTPLGRIELCSATFTYPLKAEKGTFHIKTPERTFILKAVTQELMLYWLQQLQLKRWQHRQTSTCPDLTNNNNTPEDFLPALKSPLGLVGEGAANVPSQRTPLTNMSLKHPLIEIQNSVHSLRKRSSQEWSQSVFHVDAPPWTPPSATDANTTAPSAPTTPIEPPTPPPPPVIG